LVDRAFADLPRDNAEKTYDTLERELGGYIALPGEHATRPQIWHRHKALLVIAFLALLVVVARFILIGADPSPSAADVAGGWARCRFVAGMIDCEQLVIDRNDEYGAAEGIQAVLVGTFPRVRVVSHIDWDQSITTSELRSESGELTAWFHGQGKGTFSFHFEFVNEYTELSSHPALWLVAGTAQPGGG